MLVSRSKIIWRLALSSTLTTKIDTIQLEISLIREDFDKIHQRVAETERRFGDTENTEALSRMGHAAVDRVPLDF